MESKSSTVDKEEVEQFSRIASEWWNPHGKFKPLHDIGPVRLEWIIKGIRHQASGISEKSPSPMPNSLKNVRLLDIGCGGGLISEPLARLGANVTGIDASEKNIAVAKLHAEQSGIAVDYRATTAEDLLATGAKYDVVLALEIVEHVANVDLFVKCCAELVKPGGIIIMSTLNRTFKSYAFAIVGAEYVMRVLPRGTHDWNKFLKPAELCRALQKNDITISEMTGLVLDPLSWKWKLKASDLDVNYLVAGKKAN